MNLLRRTQIAGFARDELSTPEIGTRLVIYSRTVEWHLRNVFTTPGISSRKVSTGSVPLSTPAR